MTTHPKPLPSIAHTALVTLVVATLMTSVSLSSGMGGAVQVHAATGSTVASMPTSRHDLAAVTGHDGKIYTFGGLDNHNEGGDAVHAYDPPANSWSTKASMPTARSSFAVAAGHDGKIYAIGGGDGDQIVGAVEAYDPSTNAWSSEASMPTPRYFLTAATGPDGRIFAIGGSDNNAGWPVPTVEAHDPAINTWGVPPPLPVRLTLTYSSLEVGQKQTVTVVTAPKARVGIIVRFPKGIAKTKFGAADSKGGFTWSFKQPPGRTKGKDHTVIVEVSVWHGSDPGKGAIKHYRIT